MRHQSQDQERFDRHRPWKYQCPDEAALCNPNAYGVCTMSGRPEVRNQRCFGRPVRKRWRFEKIHYLQRCSSPIRARSQRAIKCRPAQHLPAPRPVPFPSHEVRHSWSCHRRRQVGDFTDCMVRVRLCEAKRVPELLPPLAPTQCVAELRSLSFRDVWRRGRSRREHLRQAR